MASRRGDQGFLNSYFQGFASAPVFEPGLDDAAVASQRYMRLPTQYNADIGLYVINGNKWSIPNSEIRCRFRVRSSDPCCTACDSSPIWPSIVRLGRAVQLHWLGKALLALRRSGLL